MTNTMIAYWYRKIAAFTRIIDKYNHANDPLIATTNDAIRRIVEAATGLDDSDTQVDMPAVDMEGRAGS